MTDMTKQPREFWISIGMEAWQQDEVVSNPACKTEHHIHVLEAGPVLEKIKRLKAALQKCKEQRDNARPWNCDETTFINRDNAELESILEGR